MKFKYFGLRKNLTSVFSKAITFFCVLALFPCGSFAETHQPMAPSENSEVSEDQTLSDSSENNLDGNIEEDQEEEQPFLNFGYTVELILFKHTDQQGLDAENWTRPLVHPSQLSSPEKHSDYLSNPSSEQVIAHTLDSETNTANSDINQIEAQSDRQPIDARMPPKAMAPQATGNETISSRTASEAQPNDPALITEQPFTPPKEYLAIYNIATRRTTLLRPYVEALHKNQFKLISEAIYLKRSKHFELISHFGWTQPAYEKSSTLPLRIIYQSEPMEITPNVVSEEGFIKGQLSLYVSRYLHFNIDLSESHCLYQPQENEALIKDDVFTPTESTQAAATDTLSQPEGLTLFADSTLSEQTCVTTTYGFQQSRRMRSRTLHYIDHPIYGILVTITPYTPPKPEQLEKSEQPGNGQNHNSDQNQSEEPSVSP